MHKLREILDRAERCLSGDFSEGGPLNTLRDLVAQVEAIPDNTNPNGIIDLQLQTCKRCCRRDMFNFWVPDETWQAVAGAEWTNHVLCLACFDSLAYQKDIEYGHLIEWISFTGDMACLGIKIEWATDRPEREH